MTPTEKELVAKYWDISGRSIEVLRMSRIGRMPITVPQGVSVEFKENEIIVKGPKGELSRRVNPEMDIK